MNTYTALIYREGELYVAECPEIGSVSQGKSIEQAARQIAKALGVSDKTVATQREYLEAGSEIPSLSQMIGSDGKEYPRQIDRVRKPVSVFNPTKREERAKEYSCYV